MAQVMERKLLPLVATHLNTFCDQLSVCARSVEMLGAGACRGGTG